MLQADFESRYKRIYEFAESTLQSAPGCHDFDHTLRVLRNAERLAAEMPEADLQVIRLAALLHDIARPQEMSSKGKLCHARKGAEICACELKKYDFPQAMIDKICACIRTHRFRGAGPGPQSLEAEIIYDADKLDSIGAVGIGRAFHFAGRENARVHNTSDEALNSEPYSREDSAHREYLVKLRHVADKMLTPAGRRHAAARAEFMHDFFEQMEKEIEGEL